MTDWSIYTFGIFSKNNYLKINYLLLKKREILPCKDVENY